MGTRTHRVRAAGAEHCMEVLEYRQAKSDQPGRLRIRLNDEEFDVEVRIHEPGRIQLGFSDRSEWVELQQSEGGCWASHAGCHLWIEPVLVRRSGKGRDLPREVTPPMPAAVVRVLVTPGDRVEKGQPLVVVSAMKMETTLVAPRDGVVLNVNAAEGDKVSPGQNLVDIHATGDREEEDD
jgi:biotin carboxyl carrier protein